MKVLSLCLANLRRKLFSGAPVKCVFLYGSNNSDCVIFGNATFGEINDRSLRTTPFQKKKFAMEGVRLYPPYVKKYF